jgi:NTE family protein
LDYIPTVNADSKCRALSLMGGGAKGAYEVGVLQGLLKVMDPFEMRYDVVTGVSIGALNGAFFSLYKPG